MSAPLEARIGNSPIMSLPSPISPIGPSPSEIPTIPIIPGAGDGVSLGPPLLESKEPSPQPDIFGLLVHHGLIGKEHTRTERKETFDPIAYHEIAHALSIFGKEKQLQRYNPSARLNLDSITVFAPEQRRNSHVWGQVKVYLPIDERFNEPHHLLTAPISAAPMLTYKNGVHPTGINDDTRKLRRSLMDYYGFETYEKHIGAVLKDADTTIREMTGPHGHYLIEALAYVLTPRGGRDIRMTGEQLKDLIGQIRQLFDAEGIRGNLELVTDVDNIQALDTNETIASILSGMTNEYSLVTITRYGDKVKILVGEEHQVCQFCQGFNPSCPHCGGKPTVVYQATNQLIS